MNEETFYKIKLDLVHNTINNFVHVMQYDDGVAYIRAEIYKDWQHVYPSEEFDSAELRLKKHDGAWIKCNSVEPYIPVAKPSYEKAKTDGVYYYYQNGNYILVTSSMTEQAYDALDPNLFYKNVGTIISLEHDYVKINVVEELTDIPGGCPAVIDLYSADGHIQTAKFVLDVDRNPIQTGETVKNVPEDVSAKLREMANGIANTVKVVPQTLTDEEKAQARENIGVGVSDINIENGSGDHSVIQKVIPSSTGDPNNYATGKEAVSLGRYSITKADRAMTINYDNKNYGKWSFVANKSNRVGSENGSQDDVQSNAAFNEGNIIEKGIEGFISGKSNINYEGDRFNISGSENKNHTNLTRMAGWKNEAVKEIKTVIPTGGGTTPPDTPPAEPETPYDYTTDFGYNDISGTQNKVFAMGASASGVAGICYSPFGSTEGFWTKAGYIVEKERRDGYIYFKPQGLGAKAFGVGTWAKEDYTVAGGQQSQALAKCSVALGIGTIANSECCISIGKYNVGYSDSVFEVGGGYTTTWRLNLLTLYKDGRLVNKDGKEFITDINKTDWAHEGAADAGKILALDSTGNLLLTNADNPTLESHLVNKKFVSGMFLKVYTTTTMNTSTLPAMPVPALTAQQVGQIQTAMSQGKVVTIDATHNSVTNQLKVIESDHDGAVGGIRVTYYNNYVDYTLDGTQVTATYTPIGGSSGGSLYRHTVKFAIETYEEVISDFFVVLVDNYDEAYTSETIANKYGHCTFVGHEDLSGPPGALAIIANSFTMEESHMDSWWAMVKTYGNPIDSYFKSATFISDTVIEL